MPLQTVNSVKRIRHGRVHIWQAGKRNSDKVVRQSKPTTNTIIVPGVTENQASLIQKVTVSILSLSQSFLGNPTEISTWAASLPNVQILAPVQTHISRVTVSVPDAKSVSICSTDSSPSRKLVVPLQRAILVSVISSSIIMQGQTLSSKVVSPNRVCVRLCSSSVLEIVNSQLSTNIQVVFGASSRGFLLGCWCGVRGSKVSPLKDISSRVWGLALRLPLSTVPFVPLSVSVNVPRVSLGVKNDLWRLRLRLRLRLLGLGRVWGLALRLPLSTVPFVPLSVSVNVPRVTLGIENNSWRLRLD
ncbi:hypothetical protein BCR33DRAFT_714962 [Rhizoclosmatium globosum]|uniref:Uncharacterized protein n=1 Tax=Rhizoclosmatium globosum TaxID=329046 RepID=A0A1Y2CLL8_9FUNG|nr:hypothetical protein BCR33DRAFT_714962 [Rhizoclosmatium globosum]|eukprot:ORY47921.1 hypothetical protein BCR33DRAFT_714962 [Rhizoclosmatium globosum]